MKLASAKQLCLLRTRPSIAEVHVVVSFARVLLSKRRTCKVHRCRWSSVGTCAFEMSIRSHGRTFLRSFQCTLNLLLPSRRRSHLALDQRELLYHVIYNVQLSCISLYYSVGVFLVVWFLSDSTAQTPSYILLQSVGVGCWAR